jgi:hypothetical protein
MIYQAIYQPLEHTIHITKVLQMTGASGAQPTEVQSMLAAAAETIGAFTGLYARIQDSDLENSFEDQTPRKVAEHVRGSVAGASRRVKEALAAPEGAAAS